jgi:hypothetical protein
MKYIFKILLAILLMGVFLSVAFSQETGEKGSQTKNTNCLMAKNRPTRVIMMVRTAPKLTIEMSGFYNYGVFELSANDNGDFSSEEFTRGDNFGVRHGLGGSFLIKIPLHQKGNIRLNIQGMYSLFSSKFDKIAVGEQISSYVKYSVYTGAIGLENNFTPNHKIKTLAGAGLLASVISGYAHLSAKTSTQDIAILPAFRLGIQIFSGFEYLLNDHFGLNMGFKFNHANVWLKDSKSSGNPNEIYLNDKRVSPRIPYSGWKQFAWGSFYGGVNVYFGIERKTYILKNF